MPTVLIAEDDLLMADMLSDTLTESGYDVCGIANTVDKAVELGERHKPDFAVLDIRLAEGGLGTDIPARLNNPGRMGVLYASGHVPLIGLTSADGDALLSKPYRPSDVVSSLRIVEHFVGTGEIKRPFPKGFTLLGAATHGDMELRAEDADFLQTARRKIARLNHERATFVRFSTFAFGNNNVDEVLTETARACAQGLGVANSKICRYRSEEHDLIVEAGIGWNEGVIGRVNSRVDESTPQGRAFFTEQPVICNDLRRDSSFVLPSSYAEHGIVSTIAVIIRADGQPYGVLEVCSPTCRDFDKHDTDYLTAFANVLAATINISGFAERAVSYAATKDD
jgi:CheY-like chemotaxis protein/putative methionine-R-sulfoxide reductase with GAF domain